MMGPIQGEECSDDFDMQLIGNFLSFASRGDRVGLNQMLREGMSPNIQDYDKRTALHLAASEGHAPIIELLLHYKANVNLKDRWKRTPLTDARLYGHQDICRILEVNGGIDFVNDQPMTIRYEEDSNELNIDMSELNLQHSCAVEQGVFGVSEKVKWRGTWVVKTAIQRILSAKDNSLLRELRHPNILQFLGSIIHGEETILITEYLSRGNLDDILRSKVRLDLLTVLRYALDIARGMNYLHEHKPFPIVHHHLHPRNLPQDEAGHLKIGEYWVQMFYEQIQPNQGSHIRNDTSSMNHSPDIDTQKDVSSFGMILYQMLEGRDQQPTKDSAGTSVDLEPRFHLVKGPKRIQELIEQCTSKGVPPRPSFAGIIEVLEDVLKFLTRAGCPVC